MRVLRGKKTAAALLTIAFLLELLVQVAVVPAALADFSWANSKGPGRGDVNSLEYDGTRNIVYAGSENRGIWRHKDGSWAQLSGILDYKKVCDIAYDPGRNILYVATWDIGAWRITDPDTSHSLTRLDGAMTTSRTRSLTYDGTRNQLYCGTYDTGVWRCDSPNTSITWTDIGGGVSGYTIPSLTCDTSINKVYAGTQGHGVWRCDTPTTSPQWTDVSGELSDFTIESLEYDENHNIVYAGPGGNGVWRCDNPDTAPSWEKFAAAMGFTTFDDLFYDGTGNTLYAATNSNAIRNISPENSDVWNWIIGSGFGYELKALYFDDVGNTLYAGSIADAVHSCADPVGDPVWSDMGWIHSHNVTDILYDEGNNVIYASTSNRGGVWRCDNIDVAPTWNQIWYEYSEQSLALDSISNILYVGSSGASAGHGVWQSSSPLIGGGWSHTKDTGAFWSLAYDSENNILYAGGQGSSPKSVWRCIEPDNAPVWEDIGGAITDCEVYSVAFDEARDILYAATFEGGVWRNDNPIASLDWTSMDGDVSEDMVYSLAYDDTGNILYAGTGGHGVYRCTSPDVAPNWEYCGVGGCTARSLALNDASNLLYAGTYSAGVWCVEDPDGSPSWSRTGGDIESTSVYALEHDSVNNLVYAAPYGMGVWYAPDTPPTEILSVNPTSAVQSQSMDVEIVGSGTHFQDGISQADFGAGVTVNSTTVADSTHATANVSVDAAAAPGPRDVSVTTGAEIPAPLEGGFTVRDARIVSVDPDTGGLGQCGVEVEIVGVNTNFQPGATATFSGDGITVNNTTVTNETQATANIDIDPGAIHGAGDVNVISGGEIPDQLSGGFTLVDYPAPTVGSVDPDSGLSGDVVSITNLSGENFRGGALVKLRSVGQADIEADDVDVVNPNQITCKFNLAGARGGAWDVYVENDDGKNDTKAEGFNVETTPEYPAPTVTGIIPSSAINDGTVSVTNLKGTNFRNGATVKLEGPSGAGDTGAGTINATNVNVVYAAKITCKFNLNGAAAGSYKVKVTNTDGKSGSKTGAFTVNEAEVTTPTWYLAEGTTDWGFDCYITIQNPNDSAVSATVTYMTDAGALPGGDIDLPANS